MFQNTILCIVCITQKCNMNCKYCFEGDKTNYPSKIMTFETFKNLVDHIKKDFIFYGVKDKKFQILLHGGEPTLLPLEELEKFLEYASNNLKPINSKFELLIQTNGLKLNKDYRDCLKKYNVSTGISVDALTNNLRTSNIDASVVLENAKASIQEGLNPGFISVANKYNIKEVFKFSDNFGIPRSLKLVPCQNVDPNFDYEPSKKDLFENVFLPNYELFKKTGNSKDYLIQFMIEAFIMDYFTIHTNRNQSTCGFKDCGGGINLIAVLPDGTVHCCDRFNGNESFYDDKIINVKGFDFLNIKQFSKLLGLITFNRPYHKSMGCDYCLFSYICQRPCPVIAYKYYGEHKINPSHCEYVKDIYHFLERDIKELFLSLADNFPKGFAFSRDKILKLKRTALYFDFGTISIKDDTTLLFKRNK